MVVLLEDKINKYEKMLEEIKNLIKSEHGIQISDKQYESISQFNGLAEKLKDIVEQNEGMKKALEIVNNKIKSSNGL